MTGGREFVVQAFAGVSHPVGLVRVDRHDGRGEGCQHRGPGDAPVVVVLFDGSGHDAAYPDAVAAHDRDLLAAVLVGDPGVHGFAVLGTQLKDVPDLDAAPDDEPAVAVRAGVAGDHVADVRGGRGRTVPLPVGPGQVVAVAIGPAHEIGAG